MLPKELVAKVKYIEITTGRLVNSMFAGEYQSVFKGRGMEFDEVREYDPQDDIRDIDWNVTARMGHPYTKKFVEEREMTVMFLVDASFSGQFGTRERTKSELIAEMAALLAFSAVKNNDRVGLIIFSDRAEKFIPPKKGRMHVLRVIREILSFKPIHKRTNLATALKTLNDVVTRRSTVFLFSDFLDENYEKMLKISHKKHDLTSVVVKDPVESQFPDIWGQLSVQDSETGEIFSFHSSKKFRMRFLENAQKKAQDLKNLFASIGMDYIEITNSKPYIDDLIRFFQTRARRFRH